MYGCRLSHTRLSRSRGPQESKQVKEALNIIGSPRRSSSPSSGGNLAIPLNIQIFRLNLRFLDSTAMSINPTLPSFAIEKSTAFTQKQDKQKSCEEGSVYTFEESSEKATRSENAIARLWSLCAHHSHRFTFFFAPYGFVCWSMSRVGQSNRQRLLPRSLDHGGISCS